MKASSEWYRHLPEDEQKDFIEVLVHSRLILGRLRQMLIEKESALEREEMDKEKYLSAGYPFWQAHINGRRAELQSIRRLLDFIEG
jgi:hypothetical protein